MTDRDALGTSVTVINGELVFFEFMQIERRDDRLVFNAFPRGIGPNPFTAESIGNRRMTFASPEHDYPQRITYERRGNDLVATVSLMDGSRATSWMYRRCATWKSQSIDRNHRSR